MKLSKLQQSRVKKKPAFFRIYDYFEFLAIFNYAYLCLCVCAQDKMQWEIQAILVHLTWKQSKNLTLYSVLTVTGW